MSVQDITRVAPLAARNISLNIRLNTRLYAWDPINVEHRINTNNTNEQQNTPENIPNPTLGVYSIQDGMWNGL